MTVHSRLLSDPTDAELIAACEEVFRLAAAAAGFAHATPPSFGQLLALAAGRGEGVAGEGAYLRPGIIRLRFGACWWTDPFGRRHWQLDAGLDQGVNRHAVNQVGTAPAFTLAEERHPLEWLGPALVCGWRSPPGRFVVACRCGFAGTPESLGWAGPACGPCSDREQEGLPPLGTPVHWDVGPAEGVARGPGGGLLVWGAAGFGVYAAAGDATPRWGGPHEAGRCVAASPDGFVAVQTGDPTICVYNAGGEWDSSAVLSGRIGSLMYAAGGRRLYGVVVEHPYNSLVAWDIDTDGSLDDPNLVTDLRDVNHVAVSPDGQRLYLGGGRTVTVHDALTVKDLETLTVPADATVLHVTGLPDGSLLASVSLAARPGRGVDALYRWGPAGEQRWTSRRGPTSRRSPSALTAGSWRGSRGIWCCATRRRCTRSARSARGVRRGCIRRWRSPTGG